MNTHLRTTAVFALIVGIIAFLSAFPKVALGLYVMIWGIIALAIIGCIYAIIYACLEPKPPKAKEKLGNTYDY